MSEEAPDTDKQGGDQSERAAVSGVAPFLCLVRCLLLNPSLPLPPLKAS